MAPPPLLIPGMKLCRSSQSASRWRRRCGWFLSALGVRPVCVRLFGRSRDRGGPRGLTDCTRAPCRRSCVFFYCMFFFSKPGETMDSVKAACVLLESSAGGSLINDLARPLLGWLSRLVAYTRVNGASQKFRFVYRLFGLRSVCVVRVGCTCV